MKADQDDRKRVLLIPDVPGWAWDKRARALQKYSPPDYFVEVKYERFGKQIWYTDWNAVLEFNLASAVPLLGTRHWGYVANAGVLEDWPITDRVRYVASTASRMKNRQMTAQRLPVFGGVICVNPLLIDDLRQFNSKTIFLLTGVDHELYRPLSRTSLEAPLTVGWCGKRSVGDKFSPKGFDEIVLPAFESLRSQGVRVRMEYEDDAGASTSGDGEAAIVIRCNARTSATALNDEQMAYWYNACDVFMCTSCSEGTPSTIFEAMACGRPVIATPVGLVPLLQRGGGRKDYLLELEPWRKPADCEKTVRRLEATLRWCRDNRERLRVAGSHARRAVEHNYTWRHLAPQWLEMMTNEHKFAIDREAIPWTRLH